MVSSPLLDGNAAATAALRSRATEVCVVYRDHPMPPGVTPPTARIGVEIDRDTRRAVLWVERGLRYHGSDPQVRAWIGAGERRFTNLDAAAAWLSAAVAGRAVAGGADIDAAVAACPRPGGISAVALAAALREAVHGQERALERLAQHVARHLSRPFPRRPATAFLLGPTGVGKTRTAERLAEVLTRHGRGERRYDWLRLDLNEYRERHRVSRLLGAPPGYIGYDDGAVLTDALLANPRQIVLFDEIDKAHPDVLTVLMNLIDRGRLTAAGRGGREVDARHAVLLFTTNQAADRIVARLDEPGLSDAELDELCRSELRRSGVAAELLGRVRCLLAYRPLDQHALARIAAGSVREVAAEFGLEVAGIDAAALRELLAGYTQPSLGARPMEHAVEEALGNAFAALADEPGGRSVVCGHDGSAFLVRRVPGDGPPSTEDGP